MGGVEMKKKLFTIFICISLVTIFCLLFIERSHFSNQQLDKVVIGTKEIIVSIAQTKDEQARGLSGRASLNRDEGMLFLFINGKSSEFFKHFLAH